MISELSPLKAVLAAMTGSKIFSDYFKKHYKVGSKWYFGGKEVVNNGSGFSIITSRTGMPSELVAAINEFNNVPQVVLHRTHGRTTLVERMQMAYFNKFISTDVVARKFAVSNHTVCTYAGKFGGSV
jgi:hypothetical protein